jgi:phage-related protein
LAISTALPLDLGNVLGGVVESVGGAVNGVTGLLDDVLGNVEDVLSGLTSTVSQLLQQVVQILKIPSGTNPLSFIQNLINQLDNILAQLLGSVGSGVEDVVGKVLWIKVLKW